MFTASGNYVLENGGTHAICHGPDRDEDARLIAELLNAYHEAPEPPHNSAMDLAEQHEAS